MLSTEANYQRTLARHHVLILPIIILNLVFRNCPYHLIVSLSKLGFILAIIASMRLMMRYDLVPDLTLMKIIISLNFNQDFVQTLLENVNLRKFVVFFGV